MNKIFLKMFEIYELPGQSFWRTLEFQKIRELKEKVGFERPVLEVGCGDGLFSSLVFEKIDDAIDLNPRAIERARLLNNVYVRFHVMDACKMQFKDNSFKTVFANCVLEHIPNVDQLIENSFKVLAQGGLFVATVPLIEMNNFLLSNSAWYAVLRRNQLFHINLFNMEQWKQMFLDVGFSRVEFYPYFYDNQCRLWDSLDFPISIGYKYFTLGNSLRLLSRVIPSSIIRQVRKAIIEKLIIKSLDPGKNIPCATAFIAFK